VVGASDQVISTKRAELPEPLTKVNSGTAWKGLGTSEAVA
jgi:hypothetical protein